VNFVRNKTTPSSDEERYQPRSHVNFVPEVEKKQPEGQTKGGRQPPGVKYDAEANTTPQEGKVGHKDMGTAVVKSIGLIGQRIKGVHF
jgi:hypothetical protein